MSPQGSERRLDMDSSVTIKPSPLLAQHPHFSPEVLANTKNLQHSSNPSSSFVQPSQSLSILPVLVSKPDSPATRTGPPRSLSFVVQSRSSTASSYLNDLYESPFPNNTKGISTSDGKGFRGPLENLSPRLQKPRNTQGDHRNVSGAHQETPILVAQSPSDPTHNHSNSLHDAQGKSRKVETQQFGGHTRAQLPPERAVTSITEVERDGPDRAPFRHSVSLPHRTGNDLNADDQDKGTTLDHVGWARLRSLLPHRKESIPRGPSVIISNAVNIIDELITGGLSTLMLKLWFERDENGQRRIPILLHRLRIRVSDSLHPMHGHHSVFRIECEYANGAARWVVYRQLRDFWLLHTHYAVSSVYNRNIGKLPDFPTSMASIHYYNLLKTERGDKITKADFARLQREGLESYFIELIRAVMTHPSANRLCTFLEMSSIFITLAHSHGAQFKAGFLRIETLGSSIPHFGRKSARWHEKRERRWCVVSDSYLVAMEEPGELDVWDVFLLDSDFRIERPKRYYRQGFDLIFSHEQAKNHISSHETQISPRDNDPHTLASTLGTWMSKVFHNPLSLHGADSEKEKKGSSNEDADPSPSSSTVDLRAPTPLLDPSTNTNPLQDDTDILGPQEHAPGSLEDEKRQATVAHETLTSRDVSKHTFYIVNSQMRLKLVAGTNRQMLQFLTALEKAAGASPYTGSNRFNSFAPIRLNVSAQWLVDGRDYFWNLSRAISLAKESIYIHDWWLSPEMLLRRPHKAKYRLDHMLQRKAREGVKIYIILYQEVSNRATPTDSSYAKQRLINLHDNIMVQRSPSHLQTGTLYWAHHEKMCVIDRTIAFMGGLDLCFGRWDTPQHVLLDDVADTDRPEIWPGKDYSNPRTSDFYGLDKPQDDMYDRTKIPRMPWHDVGMQVIGQPACDLARHFVQRWNYLLRIKNHTKKIPFLLPPPEFQLGELERLCLTGTCELQICRSAGPWSSGTPARIEHSIHTAYLRAIRESEHFVYIENQFFITSTAVGDIKIRNHIADAIVHRIIRAHTDGSSWKCCVLLPLLPGFTFPVDHSDASAVRIILECQNRSICRGPDSIFTRLRKQGIKPDDYITFFSLRNWAKMRGDVLTTEQVYIHAKLCIVDDRLVIIGSANINERSQRGDRDSELAAVIRDTDMVESFMAGRPFKVGRFAHSLRVRLMREHLGIDVDSLDEENLSARQPVERYYEQGTWDPDTEQTYGQGSGITHISNSKPERALGNIVAGNIDQVPGAEVDDTISNIALHLRKAGLHEFPSQNYGKKILGVGPMKPGELKTGLISSMARNPEAKIVDEKDRGRSDTVKQSLVQGKSWDVGTSGLEKPPDKSGPDLDNQRSPSYSTQSRSVEREAVSEEAASQTKSRSRSPWTVPTKMPKIESDDFSDPISDRFWNDIWKASAIHNTEIFRKVFHAIPDDHVTTWKQYKEYVIHHERLNKYGNESGAPTSYVPSETGHESVKPKDLDVTGTGKDYGDGFVNFDQTFLQDELPRNTRPFEPWERQEMERLLGEVNGHLVLYPTKFLEAEDDADNFLFNADRLLPLLIYV